LTDESVAVAPPGGKSQVGRALLLLVLLILAGLILLGALREQRIATDNALYLQIATGVLDGEVPYVDVVDTNPPWIIYLSTVPVMIARLTGSDPIASFFVVIGLLALVGAIEIVLLLGSLGRFTTLELAVVVLAWAGVALYSWQISIFGQRDQIYVMMMIPYALGRGLWTAERPVPVWAAVLLGLQAGVGVCIKPTFLLGPIFVEGAALMMRRSWRGLLRPEVLALAAVGLGYCIHWLIVPEAMRESFFERWLPQILVGYGAYGTGPLATLLNLFGTGHQPVVVAFGLVGVVAGVLAATRADAAPRAILLVLVALTLASLVGFVQQGKGFHYHRLPFVTAGLMAGAVALVATTRQLRAAGYGRVAEYVLGILVSVGAVSGLSLVAARLISYDGPAGTPPSAIRDAVLNHTEVGDRVLILWTSNSASFPMLLELGRRAGSRYYMPFPITFYYRGYEGLPERGYRRPESMAKEEWAFLTDLAEDLNKLRPSLVLVSAAEGCRACPTNFSIYDYLMGFRTFRLTIDTHYKSIGRVDSRRGGPYEAFTVRRE